jgi:hypothetical protein
MKVNKIPKIKKLNLNKKTIARLHDAELKVAHGGLLLPPPLSYCICSGLCPDLC